MDREAEFSEDGKYRYVLGRIWDDTRPFAMCIGLNPSRADASRDDPTITRLISTLGHLGFGGLKMTNLYGLVSPKPEGLQVPDPVGDNDRWLKVTAFTCQEVIFCWGAFKKIEFRAGRVIRMFPDGKCFGKNKDGSPWHPLAMMYAGLAPDKAQLIRFRTKGSLAEAVKAPD